ncbi:MAG TPA: VOC family protein [Candidatus Binataceae bacterium]|nr:VOC family protein [Candidatus Binataceae bacterium]
MGIKVQDIAFVRFCAPDLDGMEAFLSDFGMVRADRAGDVLYMRGSDPDPFLHVTHRGDPEFAGVAFEAASMGDLEAIANAERASIEKLDGPGGGAVVKLTDPNGFSIEVIAGRVASERIGVARAEPANSAYETPRQNAVKRLKHSPSHVKRLGHCVLNVKDFRESEAWYKSRFGLITSDEVSLAPGKALGAFLRCDRGAIPSDHHTLFLIGSGKPKFNHAAFEVADFDDLMCGNDWLTEKGRHHEWGVGRHVLGSQIFDYWRDPWGHTVEHWTDGDLLDAAWGSHTVTIQELMGSQWGPATPPTMG